MRRSEGAINPPVHPSDDTRPLSLWIIPVLSHTPSQHQIILQSWAEHTYVVKTTPRSLCLHLTLSFPLSTVPYNDTGCGYVNPESRKNRCGPDTAHILL